jgi:hypothetical protein
MSVKEWTAASGHGVDRENDPKGDFTGSSDSKRAPARASADRQSKSAFRSEGPSVIAAK